MLSVGVRADVTGVFPDPAAQSEAFTIDASANVFEGLTRFDSRLQPIPALADHWRTVDERTWVFHLRPEARFSDGSPVTPEDVAASLDPARTARFITATFLQAIESAEPLPGGEVRIVTRGHYPVLPAHLTFGFVLPERFLRGEGPPLGAGPYRLGSWTRGRELVLLENPSYHGGPTGYEEVRFVVLPGDEERVQALREGRVQLIDNVPLEALARLRAERGVKVLSEPGLRVLFLGLRVDRAPFSSPLVREAFDLAIDRTELVARALGGAGAPASQVVPPAVFGHNGLLAVPRPDRARAKELLAKAGYPAGLSVRLDGTNDRYVRDEAVLAEVARQLALVGVNVTVRAMSKRDFFPLVDAGRSGFFLLGWSCDSGHAGDVLEALFHSPTGGALGAQNAHGLADAELDALVDAASRERDMPTRARRLAEALARVAALRPALPLHIQTESIALRDEVDWVPPPSMALRLHDLRPTGR